MTVLMFGWEFPPHLSGGLGTACHGLATALKEQDVKLLFVVPKARGDESIPLISASEVTIAADDTVVRTVQESVATGSWVIPVAATIRPYVATAATRAVEHWHWQYTGETLRTIKNGGDVRYSFSGGYGPSLLEEVARYADVAGVIARQNNFDVIHAHDWLSFPAGVEAKNASGKPLIVHVHATEIDRAGENNIDRRVFDMERQGMLAADLVIAVSQWTKDIIVRKYGIHPGKIHVVHNGVMEVQVGHRSLIPKISEHVVTFLGRVTYQKGPQYFIEAARKVLDYFPDTHFIMAGSGDLLPAMIDRAAELEMSSRIHFTGFLRGKQIQQVWSVTDVYVMPSVSEPFGITPLEAVQAGVPVIVSNQSGVAEAMDHIIKVDFWDTRALADAIIGVFRHKGLSDTLRSNGRKEIKTLTWKRAAGKIKQLYHEL